MEGRRLKLENKLKYIYVMMDAGNEGERQGEDGY